MKAQKGKLICEGKAKQVYETDQPDQVIIEFKDSLTADDGRKRGYFKDKGLLCAQISSYLFKFLNESHLSTHFILELSEKALLCERVRIIPIEVIIRNIAAGGFSRRYSIQEGTILPQPIVEFFLKDDSLGDPLINSEAIISLGLASQQDLELCRAIALRANELLKSQFSLLGVNLVDMKFEFGKNAHGKLLLADEISPDTMRLWNEEEGRLDKDRFRRDLGGIERAYRRILAMLQATEPISGIYKPLIVDIMIWPKPSVRDPAGDVTRRSLLNLGFKEVQKVRIGKQIRLELDPAIEFSQIDQMVQDLLSNDLIEENQVRILE
ncbi:MAG: phosphoribosylaminoimidazolesuccinocarboxamide synthase [Candidatus Hodarchaeota archaeon]